MNLADAARERSFGRVAHHVGQTRARAGARGLQRARSRRRGDRSARRRSKGPDVLLLKLAQRHGRRVRRREAPATSRVEPHHERDQVHAERGNLERHTRARGRGRRAPGRRHGHRHLERVPSLRVRPISASGRQHDAASLRSSDSRLSIVEHARRPPRRHRGGPESAGAGEAPRSPFAFPSGRQSSRWRRRRPKRTETACAA